MNNNIRANTQLDEIQSEDEDYDDEDFEITSEMLAEYGEMYGSEAESTFSINSSLLASNGGFDMENLMNPHDEGNLNPKNRKKDILNNGLT